MAVERRSSIFREKLSFFMVVTAAIGGFLILLDPRFSGEIFGQPISFGGEGFSAELKGAVVTIMLIGGWSAVKEYWLGASADGQKTNESISRIAESATPTIRNEGDRTIRADDVKVSADNVQVTKSE